MEIFYSVVLAVSAFWLGACPFSVWIGRLILDKDIRKYGDGNPGAINVFRAGGRKAGYLAIILDAAKGAPFVFLAYSFFGLPVVAVMAVALSAILGHAFSPMLGFRGGKSIAVTFGVLLALPQYGMVITLAGFIFLAFLFIESDAWTVILGTAGSLVYLMVTRGGLVESLFMLCILVVFIVKHFNDLQTTPRARVRLTGRLQSRRR